MITVVSGERIIFRNVPLLHQVEFPGPIPRDQLVADVFTSHEQERLRGMMDDSEFIEATTRGPQIAMAYRMLRDSTQSS
jgi:hypothetical protein